MEAWCPLTRRDAVGFALETGLGYAELTAWTPAQHAPSCDARYGGTCYRVQVFRWDGAVLHNTCLSFERAKAWAEHHLTEFHLP